MGYYYELVKTDLGLPLKVFIHGINKQKMHIHKQIEILFVLKGDVNIRIADDDYLLGENDLILINPNELHSIRRVSGENMLLALQVDPSYFERHFYGFSRKVFDCKSFLFDKKEQARFDVIRHRLAKIVWELNKVKLGHSFIIGSELLLLANHLLSNFHHIELDEDEVQDSNKDINRIRRIIEYIDNNYAKGVTLKEIAENEGLSPYYLSHYIKSCLGISFQEYLNMNRLERAANLLKRTERTVIEIAFDSGFPSAKSFNNSFKKELGCTPTQFRKEKNNRVEDIYRLAPGEGERGKTYLDVDRTAAFSKLFQYLNIDNNQVTHKPATHPIRTITLDANKKGKKHKYYWKNLTTFGRAAEGLRAQWRKQLRELQREIGFKYIRFHGIFSDDMMVYNLDREGKAEYNWSYIDDLFDFFKEVNIKPFVELGFMPEEIRTSRETMFWWKANISQPKDIGLWVDLVKDFIRHCINRYGKDEVESWYFEVWNEPELKNVFWVGNQKDYFDFYGATVKAIKSISNELKVGGPSITHQALKDGKWLEDFLTYCNTNKLPLDFISLHIYSEDFSSDEDIFNLTEKLNEGNMMDLMKAFGTMKRIYHDENNTYNTLGSATSLIDKVLSYRPEIHVTEWNVTANSRNLISDTAFISTFIIRNVLKSIGQADSLGHWTFTDIMEEMKAGISHFHGGFGLMNKEGMKKPSYYAYYLLSKLGPEIVEQGEDYIITKNQRDIQILMFNFTYFDELFMSGDTSALSNKNRYQIFAEKDPLNLELNIDSLSGRYKITRYQINRQQGSVFDQWIDMGGPEDMTKEEIEFLRGKSHPKITVEYIEPDENHRLKSHIPIHGVELITLEKQY